MATVYVRDKATRLTPTMLIGKGGEADVYLLDPKTVLKRFKEPDDADYALDKGAQRGAVERLREHQTKLAAFPKGLPPAVVAPLDLAYDKAANKNRRIVGYTMPYLDNMEVLLRLGDRMYREQGGIDGNQVVAIFRDLHRTVRAVHGSGVVIGDFNDLNVLVDANGQVHLVDADSMQFGRFLCRSFTTRFLDPLISEAARLMPVRPHNANSDWYAFAVMLLQSLLYVGPYGGVHRPKTGKRLQHDERVLRRLTIFDGAVIYPKPALPLGTIPDDFAGYLHKVFERDERGEFPERLFDGLRWTACKNCGLTHARPICPACAAPGAVKATVVIRGTVKATRLFRATGSGKLLYAVVQGGKLRYLYHEGGAFKREDGGTVLSGNLDPELRFRIKGDATLLGKRDKLFVLAPGQDARRLSTDAFRNLSMFDANDRHHYWMENSQLVRDDPLSNYGGSRYIGDILTGQTLFWVGKRFGFGFYQAGRLLRAFVFDSERQGLNDRVAIPAIPGQLVDATCVFSEGQSDPDGPAWFMVSTQENGVLVNRCYVIDNRGTVLAELQASQGDNSWLASGIRGHLAVGKSLYVATDEGIVQVAAEAGSVHVQRTFPDTEPFVASTSQLLPAPTGIYAVSHNEIVLLEIK